MKGRTLQSELLAWQILVTSSACLILVGGTVLAGYLVMRRGQDHTLMQLGDTMCHGIDSELNEHDPTSLSEAARDFLVEASLAEHRVEVRAPDGGLLAEQGDLAGWTPTLLPASGGACGSVRARPAASSGSVVYRACSEDCTRGYRVTVATADALHAAPVRRVRAAMFLALPIAVLIGAVAGRHVVRRLLRPLQELTQAASRLRTRPGPRLGVGARPLELAALEASFDALLTDLGQMLARERRFAQDASHELRTPLTALSLRLEELAGRLRADTDAGSEVRKAQASVAELDRLVEALLLLARSEAAEVPMVPVNVCDVVRDVARRQADADVGASPAPEVEAPDEILIRGVEELLTHALANVTENARKYAGPGARIRLGVRRDGPWAVTTVEDDGPGIPAELRSRVFERFFRAPEQRVRCSGAGLGLPVTRAIVDRHGGSVDLDRGVLGGLAVHLRLPLCE